MTDDDDDDIDDDGDSESDSRSEEQFEWAVKNQHLQLHCLFQMFYQKHHGTKKNSNACNVSSAPVCKRTKP